MRITQLILGLAEVENHITQMNIKIISVEDKECQEIEILHIYPHSTQKHVYLRYASDDWCHFLGNLHGWKKLSDPSLYEETYQVWKRGNHVSTPKTTNK